MKRRTLVLVLIILGVLSQPGLAETTSQRWTIGNYKVLLFPGDIDSDRDATLRVTEGNRKIFVLSDHHLWVNPADLFEEFATSESQTDGDGERPFQIGRDLLGIGEPTVIIKSWSGGAHCCFDLTILTLGKTFRALPTIHLTHADGVTFKRIPDREALILPMPDYTFAYWRASFADSATAPVILSFDPATRQYKADIDLMRAPLPDDLEAQQKSAHDAGANEAAEGSDFQVPPELTGTILKLIYTGHLKEAQKFLRKAWAGKDDDRKDYWRDLTTCQLRYSQFWPTVAKMNGLPADKPGKDCKR